MLKNIVPKNVGLRKHLLQTAVVQRIGSSNGVFSTAWQEVDSAAAVPFPLGKQFARGFATIINHSPKLLGVGGGPAVNGGGWGALATGSGGLLGGDSFSFAIVDSSLFGF